MSDMFAGGEEVVANRGGEKTAIENIALIVAQSHN